MMGDSLKTLRQGLFFGFLLYTVFGILDYYMLPQSHALAWVIRLYLVAPALAIVYLISYYKPFIRYNQFILFMLMTFGQLGIVAMILLSSPEEPAFYAYYAGFILIILWTNFIFQLRFWISLYIAASTIIIYNLAVWIQQMQNPEVTNLFGNPYIIGNNFFLISSAMLTLIGAHQLKTYRRKSKQYHEALNMEKIRLQETALKAAQSDKMKTAFIQNISHELRTPLNSILGFGALLADEALSAQERKGYFENVETASHRLMNTVSDILDMALIVSGSVDLHREHAAVNPIMISAANKVKQACLEKKLELITDLPSQYAELQVYTDKEILGKVLFELLDNAVKFTDHGRIRIGFTRLNGSIRFFVEDSGQGIEPEKQDTIFQMFTQADTEITRGYEGSGLGLSIANGYVELLGGTIWVESCSGEGSTFYVELPHVEREPAAVKPQVVNTANTAKPLLLIAEDDESNAMLLEVMARKENFDYYLVCNGAEAVELCRDHDDISLVLMDIKMPVMNGEEALIIIRSFRPDLPVIATTAYVRPGDEQRFLKMGFNAYLPKPIPPKTIEKLFENYSLK